MTDILQAARSYYGLADTDVRKTDIYTNEAGQPMLVFELALSAEDFIAIGARMKNMQQPDTQPDTAIIEGPTIEAMREAYNALSKAEKGRYGSFARYMTDWSKDICAVDGSAQYKAPENEGISRVEQRMMDEEHRLLNGTSDIKNPIGLMASMEAEGRQVVHVDAPEEPEPVSMDAVWLWEDDATVPQKLHASDTRHHNRDGDYVMQYLVQWAMLTMEQRDHIHDSMLTDEQKQKAKEKP